MKKLSTWVARNSRLSASYRQLKSYGFPFVVLCIGAAAFGLSSFLVQPEPLVTNSASSTVSFVASRPVATRPSVELDKKGLRALRKTKKRELRESLRALRDDLKKQRKANGSRGGGEKLLVVFLGLLGLIAVFLIGAALSFGGNEALSSLVIFLGLIGIVAGIALAFKGINDRRRPKKK